MQALDNVVVLDLTHHIAGPYATKLLADFGADVVKVERPGGDVARRLGPFQGDEPHIEKSGLFFFLNTNKRSAVIDLKTPAGKEAFTALARRADLIVESFRPGTMDRLGIGWEYIRSVNPKASLISISNFGKDGPYRDYNLTELVLYGFAGEMYSMGMTDREPVKMAGTAALFESGAASSVAIMGALWGAKRNGSGQHVDIALAETQAGGVDRRHATAIASQFSGRKTLRAAGAASGMPGGIYPCADGYVDFTNAGLRPDRVLDMIGAPEWALDPMYSDPIQRLQPATIEEWNANFLGWCVERTKREIWTEARRARVMCGPLFTMQDLFEDDHFRGRGFWAKAEHPVMGEVEFPGRPLIMAQAGWAVRRTAPLLGQHTREVLEETGLSAATIATVIAEGGRS
ncbi:MAG: CoA transferase [Chloroflexi bacterium]|nr:CoA transferase [Chloroflexota bacterium]